MIKDIIFSPHKWLTDQEIDWALSQLTLSSNYKILPAHQFHYVSQTINTTEADAHLAFPELLNQLNTGEELIFIPVNNGGADNNWAGTHWSLLVYEAKTKKFYHYDSLRGANYEYVKPLVKELLKAQGVNEEKWEKHLVVCHDVQQMNDYDCGIYVISFTERINENSELLWGEMGEIDSDTERKHWHDKIQETVKNGSKWEEEIKEKNDRKKMVNWKENGNLFSDFTKELTWEWINRGFDHNQAKKWIEDGLKANDYQFAYYLKQKNFHASELTTKQLLKLREKHNLIEQKHQDKVKNNNKFLFTLNKKTPAQQWLNENYPTSEDKANCQELNIISYHEKYNPNGRKEKLTGPLNLQGFINLRIISSLFNELTELNLSDCKELESILCGYNLLTNLDLTSNKQLKHVRVDNNYFTKFDYSSLNPNKLSFLMINDNNLVEQNVDIFNKFTKLQILAIGNDDESKNNQFSGKLNSLKSLENLNSLHISNTDVRGCLNDLPPNLRNIFCSSVNRSTSLVRELEEQIKSCGSFQLVEGEALGQYISKSIIKGAKESAQEWVDRNFFKNDSGTIMMIRNLNLVGSLSLRRYHNLTELDCQNNQLTNLDLSQCPNLRIINCQNNQLTNLDLSQNKYLEGVELQNNQLTELNLKNNHQLTRINFSNNRLTKIPIFPNPEKLTYYHISDNKFLQQEPIFLTEFSNLTHLFISGNSFTNIWPHLQSCLKRNKKLVELHLSSLNLTGSLIIDDLPKLESICLNNNNLTKLHLLNSPKLEKLNCSDNQLTNLQNDNFPNLQELICWQNQITDLDTSQNKLLTTLGFGFNKITNLDLSNNPNLTEIYCFSNQLTSIEFLKNLPHPEKITKLNIKNNPYSEQNPDFLIPFINLEILNLSNTKFTGSLEILQSLNRLSLLSIDNTSFDSDIELLPTSLCTIYADGMSEIQKKLKGFQHIVKRDINFAQWESPESNYCYNYQDWQLNREKKSLFEKNVKVRISFTEEFIKELGITSEQLNKNLVREIKVFNQSDTWQSYLENYSNLSIDDLDYRQKSIINSIKSLKIEMDVYKKIEEFRKEQLDFDEKNKEIIYLEGRVNELTQLIKQQKQKIIEDFLNVLPEKDLIQQLIITYLDFKKAENQGIPARKLKKECQKIEDELEDKLGEEFVDKIQFILKDCEILVNWETELEERLQGKTFLIEEQKRILQVTDSIQELNIVGLDADKLTERKEIVKKHEKISERQIREVQAEKEQSLQLKIERLRGELEAKNEEINYLRETRNKKDLIEVSQMIRNLKEIKTSYKEEREIVKFLIAKKFFLKSRQATINELQKCLNELEKKFNKHEKVSEIGNAISNSGGAIKDVITFGIPKVVGEAIKSGSNFSKIKFSQKKSEDFQLSLSDENELNQLKVIYDYLINILKLDNQDNNLFNSKCQIYDILIKDGIWAGRILTPEKMEQAIVSLSENLDLLKAEWELEIKETKDKFGQQFNLNFALEENLKQQIKSKEIWLKELVSSAKSKLKDSNRFFKIKQQERDKQLSLIFNNFPTKQQELTMALENIKSDLSKKLTEEEIAQLCQTQIELIELRKELETLHLQQLEAQTQVIT